MHIRPVDLPELRAELLLWQAAHGDIMLPQWRMATEALSRSGDRDANNPLHDTRFMWQAQIETLGRAEMFHVSEGMIDLGLAAAMALPSFEVRPDDLPSRVGFIVFDRPVSDEAGNGDIAAVAWSCPGGEGVVFTPYTDRDCYRAKLDVSGQNLEALRASVYPGLVCIPQGTFTAPFGNGWEYAPPGESMASLVFPLLLTLFLLMRQPLAQTTDVHPDRAAKKRLRRAGQEPKPVRVIELRRPKRAEGSGEGSREYHHSWIVRGHWRQQWYPAREVHRPLWIAPHIKGPEDAPLIGGEKVYALKR